jgi:hydrogenase/urease accessory protein HupE
VPGSAWSHEVRPALLSVTERADGHYDFLWKQPTLGEMAVRLIPHIDGGLLDGPPSSIETSASFQIKLWRNVDAGQSGLEGRTLQIEGLGQTITDVLVMITLSDGTVSREILHPQKPQTRLHLRGNGLAVLAYIRLGIEHILTGIDHLAFVLGLTLLVRRKTTLIKTITAFTVAHSVTLALTTLHLITVRPPVVESLVALSVLFVAVELVYSYRGRITLAAQVPWVIAFLFGLLHGCAFAGALAEIGLPRDAIPLSLFLFNVGVEIGQLMFIAVIFGIGWVLTRLPWRMPGWVRWVPPYAIGSFAAFWFLERLQAI